MSRPAHEPAEHPTQPAHRPGTPEPAPPSHGSAEPEPAQPSHDPAEPRPAPPSRGPAELERENALLLAIVEATASGPDVEPLATAVARLIVDATATDVCFVHVLDDAGGSLTLVGATPPFDSEIGTVRLPIGTGVTGWVAQRGVPAVIVDNKHADPRYLPIPALRGTDFTSMASVPMISDAAGPVGVLNVHTVARREFTARDLRLLTTIGRLVAGALHSARLHRRLATRERASERFTEQVIAAQEAERRRLAGDIHDGISQRLVSLGYHLDAVASTLRSEPDFAAQQLALARELTDTTIDEARAAVGGLRPPILDDLGLGGALASLCRVAPDLECELDLVDERLPEHVEIALYRIAQEALQNVQKHAGASTVQIRFEVRTGVARLQVTDDGCGFDVRDGAGLDDRAGSGPSHGVSFGPRDDSAPETGTSHGTGSTGHAGSTGPSGSTGYGMRSMTERAELVGGSLTVRSRPGSGTTVTVTVPTSSIDHATSRATGGSPR